METHTNFRLLVMAACVVAHGAMAQAAVPAPSGSIAAVPAFDGRPWKVGYQGSNQRETVVEYVLPEETVDSWHELLTHQELADPSRSITLDALVEQNRKGLSAGCPSMRWQVLAQAEREAVYQWSDGGCDGSPAQYEIAKIRRTEKGFCRWAYATKQLPVPASTQEAVKPLLEQLPCG